jgi:hypothetical protein
MRSSRAGHAALLALLVWCLAACGTAPPAPRPAPAGTAAPAPSPTPAIQPKPVTVPQGINAGIAVFDRHTGAFTTQINATGRFRSASLVKILIALDFLLARGPAYEIGQADRTQLELMLRGSDDRAASHFYQRIGGEPGLKRMITLMALENTKPPSAVGLNGWGSTTLSANDIVRVYRYILEQSPAEVREIIMGHLRGSTPCGTDAYHQSFGIPLAFARPWTAKQGWWGFGDQPPIRCSAQTPPLPVPATPPAIRGDTPALMSGRVLHTTGTVGEGDRFVVAVLTQYPSGTGFADAFANITALTKALPLCQGC